MKFKNKIVVFVFFLLVAMLSSCELPTVNGNMKLATPVVTIDEYGIVSWEEVPNASYYEYTINDVDVIETIETVVILNDGESISVRAMGEGEYKNSSWSKTVKYTAQSITGNTVTINFVLDGEIIKTIVVFRGTNATSLAPTVTKEDDELYTYTFTGWSESINYVTTDITVEAIFTKTLIGDVSDAPKYHLSDNGIYTWDKVEDATYEALINNELVSIDGSLIELNNGDTIQIRSIIGGNTSDWTMNEEVVVKVSPKTLVNNYKDLGDYNCDDIEVASSTGEINILIVPVWFNDSTKYISESEKPQIKSDIEKAFFGTEEETGWESVHTYYYKDSYGQLNIQGFVTDWWSCNKNGKRLSESATDTLVSDAAKWAKSTYDLDYKDFDADHNGYIDCVCLIYGYYDYDSANSINDNLWAYVYWLDNSDNKDPENPAPCSYLFASYDFMYNIGGDTSHCNIDTHTYIHEMGHILGLDDYYDTNSVTNPAGGFSMQDGNVGGHDPFSKLGFGWIDPLVVTDDASITITPMEVGGDVIVISNRDIDSPFDEYIIIEFYAPIGLNEFDTIYDYQTDWVKGIDKYGIRIWHVDARLAYIDDLDEEFSASKITNIITGEHYYYQVNTNTYPSTDNGYLSPIKSFQNYNLLQLIRNNTLVSYKVNTDIKTTDLFVEGDVFNMSKFSKQFYNTGKLNDGSSLNVTITIEELNNEYARINIDFE